LPGRMPRNVPVSDLLASFGNLGFVTLLDWRNGRNVHNDTALSFLVTVFQFIDLFTTNNATIWI